MSTRRVVDEPAFVLHRYDWSESSLVLEVLTRHHGRVAVVAKGVKRPTSQFRALLLPMQPLQIAWGGDAEVRTLKSAQWMGGHVMPTGDALLAGAYLNELLMRLLARDDPHPRLYDHYTLAVQLLAEQPETQSLVVRAFELLLLKDAGLLPDLASEGHTLATLDPAHGYVLLPDAGLRKAHDDDHHVVAGARWQGLQSAVDQAAPFVPTMRACADLAPTLRIPLRNLLHYHAGVHTFRTRQLLHDMQALSRRRQGPTSSSQA
ncbi:MAG: DNA repair protein RecO [Hydrogenophaga sp.]|uniref:DNA repair protein RecO n=1 Tax=Hydrogenophaga sp. TaxID=1904254 RepID=UPI001DBEB29F|nr:DNA repair protein RecO [Hydrogenophaga sp.]MBX3609094.1 DNA repair protein RecO [Hydrogenophaga sp.]